MEARVEAINDRLAGRELVGSFMQKGEVVLVFAGGVGLVVSEGQGQVLTGPETKTRIDAWRKSPSVAAVRSTLETGVQKVVPERVSIDETVPLVDGQRDLEAIRRDMELERRGLTSRLTSLPSLE